MKLAVFACPGLLLIATPSAALQSEDGKPPSPAMLRAEGLKLIDENRPGQALPLLQQAAELCDEQALRGCYNYWAQVRWTAITFGELAIADAARARGAASFERDNGPLPDDPVHDLRLIAFRTSVFDFEAAEKANLAVLSIMPRDDYRYAAALQDLSRVYRWHKRFADAEPLDRAALAWLLNRARVEWAAVSRAQRDLAGTLLGLGRLDEAESVAQKALESASAAKFGNAELAHIILGDIYRAQNKRERARSAYIQAYLAMEDSDGQRMGAGWLCFSMRRDDLDLATARTAARIASRLTLQRIDSFADFGSAAQKELLDNQLTQRCLIKTNWRLAHAEAKAR